MQPYENDKKLLETLSLKLFQCSPEHMVKVAAHASDRRYFRLTMPDSAPQKHLIGTVGQNEKENLAFIAFSDHFHSKGLCVPRVFSHPDHPSAYLQQDLGDTSLQNLRFNLPDQDWMAYYKKTLELLVQLQFEGVSNFPVDRIFNRKHYDSTAMRWDLDSFKYSLLKPLGIPVDEDALEKDFETILSTMGLAENNFFMHRDFQSRNILIYEDKPFAIDFQGGRLGPLQYDVVSLLYQGSAALSHESRQELLEHYIRCASQYETFQESAFRAAYDSFVLLFLLKVLGTYGLRGVSEGKLYFLKSIPLALKNIRELDVSGLGSLSYISQLREQIEAVVQKWEEVPARGKLHIELQSFSYRTGNIRQNPLHGGGFVFDCRGLINPHHDADLRPFTGRDQKIKDFFLTHPEVQTFLAHVQDISLQMINNYLAKGYKNLAIAFGCTGGKHRSVYMAERLHEKLSADPRISVSLHHRELD